MEIDSRFQLAISFKVSGRPHGKESVRVHAGRGTAAKKSRAYEKQVNITAWANVLLRGLSPPLRGFFILKVVSILPRPGQRTLARALPVDPLRPQGRYYAPVTPDWDNVGKSIGDGLQYSDRRHRPVIANDSMVICGQVTTVYAAEGEGPGVRVWLYHCSELRSR